jgi:hypothetical protein
MQQNQFHLYADKFFNFRVGRLIMIVRQMRNTHNPVLDDPIRSRFSLGQILFIAALLPVNGGGGKTVINAPEIAFYLRLQVPLSRSPDGLLFPQKLQILAGAATALEDKQGSNQETRTDKRQADPPEAAWTKCATPF